jgi:SET domain-containing protein
MSISSSFAGNGYLCITEITLMMLIAPYIYVGSAGLKGRGIFTSEPIADGTIVEISPVIVMSNEDRAFLDQTLLHDYIFEWGDKTKQCCMALGYVALYNHKFQSNCEYEMDYAQQVITIKTKRDIKAGEELYINYNGDWNNEKPVWFDTE